jgi:Fe-S-cluster containining protein
MVAGWATARPEAARALPASDPQQVRVLSIHADYGCRHTGVCCSSGWDIPVELEVEKGLREALRTRALRVLDGGKAFREVPHLPHGARAVLRTRPDGRCVFLDSEDGRLCAVHRDLGPGALASACRDFPRVVTLSPLGVGITLSHYCPTAAELLFREGGDLKIVVDPPASPGSRPYEGLDARSSLGPLLRPGVLLGWEAHARWEAHAVSILGRTDLTPADAVSRLAARVEELRSWTPKDGPFDAYLERALEGWPESSGPPSWRPDECEAAWRLVAECVPPGHAIPETPPPPGRASPVDGPVRRWLAAKAFASWLALQGEGLRTTVLGLRLALGVLGAELARDPERARAPEGLREALRRADLLLVHLAVPTALARRLSRAEGARGPVDRAW